MRYSSSIHWRSLRDSDPEFYDLCYWRAAEVYADEYDDLEESPAALEVVYGSRISTLTLDQIDGEAIALFGWGYCGYLALALHELTGYELALFTNPDGDESRGWHGHAAVRLPSGGFLDIQGVATPAEISERYSFGKTVEPTIPELNDYMGIMFGAEGIEAPYRALDPLELRLLRHFADLVLKEYEIGN